MESCPKLNVTVIEFLKSRVPTINDRIFYFVFSSVTMILILSTSTTLTPHIVSSQWPVTGPEFTILLFLLFLSSSNFYTPVEDVLRSLFSSVLRLGWPSTQHVVDCLLLLLLLLLMMMGRMKIVKLLLQFTDILIMLTIILCVNLSCQV